MLLIHLPDSSPRLTTGTELRDFAVGKLFFLFVLATYFKVCTQIVGICLPQQNICMYMHAHKWKTDARAQEKACLRGSGNFRHHIRLGSLKQR